MGAILGAIGPRDLSGGRVQKRARRFFVPQVNGGNLSGNLLVIVRDGVAVHIKRLLY